MICWEYFIWLVFIKVTTYNGPVPPETLKIHAPLLEEKASRSGVGAVRKVRTAHFRNLKLRFLKMVQKAARGFSKFRATSVR